MFMEDKIKYTDDDSKKAHDALKKLVVGMAKDGKELPKTLEYVTHTNNNEPVNNHKVR